jgi:hypothetical protein
MKKTKFPSGKKVKDVPIIQLVPPVLFIRKRKREFIFRAFRKLAKGVLPHGKIKKLENGSPYSESKRVYFK